MSMSITLNTQTFDTKSSEVDFYARALELAINEMRRGRGTVTSGNIIGVSPAGVANTSLGSWSFTATKP